MFIIRSVILAGLALLLPVSVHSALIAFPNAQGFGAYATGGRTGSHYVVTNLKDSGTGSFRDAVSTSNRIVTFAVGGYINITSELLIKSDITIAGQTAPGGGIALYGATVSISGQKNIIIRHLRFRQGIAGDQHKASFAATSASNFILDHVSIEWGRWDNVDMTSSTTGTIQYSIIGEGISPQRFGCLCESTNVTLTKNLWIDNESRNPKAKGKVQFTNNVVYNWGSGGGFVEGNSAGTNWDDIIGNYFIAGPSNSAHEFTAGTIYAQVYQSNNYVDLNQNGKLDGVPVVTSDFGNVTITSTPFAPSGAFPLNIVSPVAAYNYIASYAGDSLNRDSVDTRLIGYLTSLGTAGQIIEDPATVGGTGTIASSTPPTDTDGDGISDVWEKAHGLNSTNASDAMKLASTGYTWLETYVNSLASPSI